jgi:hypothetical protein
MIQLVRLRQKKKRLEKECTDNHQLISREKIKYSVEVPRTASSFGPARNGLLQIKDKRY